MLVRQTEFDNKVDHEGSEIFEYGRYCEGTDIENELPTAISYDGKLIFAGLSVHILLILNTISKQGKVLILTNG